MGLPIIQLVSYQNWVRKRVRERKRERRETEREKQRERDRERETERQRQRQRERESKRCICRQRHIFAPVFKLEIIQLFYGKSG